MANISSYRSASNRVTGIMSGLDIDQLVKASLSGQQSKIDKANQNKTKIQWKQEAYRSVISSLNEFQSTYLDILNPKSVLRKSSMNTYSTSVPEAAQKYLKVSSGTDSRSSNLTVNSIKTIAASQVTKGENKLSSPLTMTIDPSQAKSLIGKSMSVTLDGVTKTVTFDDAKEYFTKDADGNVTGLTDINAFKDDLNEQLESLFGNHNGKAKIQISNPPEDISDKNGVNKWQLTFDVQKGSTASMSSSASVALGITNNLTNTLDTSRSVSFLFGVENDADNINTDKLLATEGKIGFTINNVDFEFSVGTSIKDIMSKVNASDAGVKMSYSSVSDTMTITSVKTGSGDNIVMKDKEGNNFLSKVFGSNGDGTFGETTPGTDAVLTINDTEIVRSNNNFTIDGVNFELLSATPEDFGDIKVESNVDSTQMLETVKGFVEGYNKLIEDLNSLLTEKANKDYPPLTDAQRGEMTEKQIENWEAQAKKGLLKGDPMISRMLISLRSAFTSTVELSDGGGKKSFASIGITTSSITASNGKITIDEIKLKAAVEADPEAVIKMFTQTSDISKDASVSSVAHLQDDNGNALYTTKAQVAGLRNSQMGVAQRFSEIFTANINPLYGSEGELIKIAGTGKNILIDNESRLGKQLSAIETNILKYQTKLYSAEDRLYAKYAALETALARMEKQNTSISSLSSS